MKEKAPVEKKTSLLKKRSQNHQAREVEGSSTRICKTLRVIIVELGESVSEQEVNTFAEDHWSSTEVAGRMLLIG